MKVRSKIHDNWKTPDYILKEIEKEFGSFLLASKQKGYDFVGCEINKDYCDIINKRLNQRTVSDFTSATPTFVSQKEFN